MPFAYYARLSGPRQAIYRQSDAATLEVPVGLTVAASVVAMRDALDADQRTDVRRHAQALITALVTVYTVPRVDVRVLAVRPSDADGELHGLYEPDEERPFARISIWMRTAQRKQVVAYKSFVRTLVHEFLHHLDYEYFKWPETFHTEGFYRRESTLANALLAAAAGVPATPPSSPPQIG